MGDDPYESPHVVDEPPPRRKRTLTSRLVAVLMIVGVVGLLVALFLPAVRTSGGAARRMQCANNLKQIAIALRSYEDVYHALPPACTVGANGRPLHSWRTLILPYLEQQALYEKIDLSKSWDDPANKHACDIRLPVYQCPAVDCPPGHTPYLAVVAAGGCFRATEPRKLAEIIDDPSLTLMVVEVGSEQSVHWMSPIDTSEQWILNLGSVARLPHPGGTQAVCVQGNVLFLTSSSKPAELRALISIDGHDDAVARGAN